MRYAQKKIYEWTGDLAYITGLMASDGCLINDGRHLNITSKDLEILDHFRTVLSLKVKTGSKTSSYGGQAFFLQFGDVALYDFFLDAGLTPAKSKTIGEITVPNEYYADFLRGVFDGDGTVYGFWDKRWRSSLMYYTGYVSASPTFVTWLSQKNAELAGVAPGRYKTSRAAKTLTYAKRDSRILYAFMYGTKSRLFLSRKHTKFIDFLNEDPYAVSVTQARVL